MYLRLASTVPCEWTQAEILERGMHQALTVFITDNGLKVTSIAQRTQKSNSIESGK